MKSIYILLIFALSLLYIPTKGNNIFFSIADGDWSDGSIWSDNPEGFSCSCTPNPNVDEVYIGHNINLDVDLTGGQKVKSRFVIYSNASLTSTTNHLRIANGGTAEIEGNGILEVGILEVENGAGLNSALNSSIVVYSSFINSNNSSLPNIDGTLTVLGSFFNGNNSYIGGNGVIFYNTASFTNNGSFNGTPNNGVIDLGTPLPVELSAFSARPIDINEVEIRWITLTEENSSHFELERSLDGRTFKTIETINSVGSSSSELHYSVLDQDIASDHSTIYYRLKQVDIDGKYDFSNIISVSFNRQQTNPIEIVLNSSFLEINSDNNSIERVVIHDIYGRKIYDKEVNLTDIQQLNVPLHELGSINNQLGIVTLHNSRNDIIKSKKLLF